MRTALFDYNYFIMFPDFFQLVVWVFCFFFGSNKDVIFPVIFLKYNMAQGAHN